MPVLLQVLLPEVQLKNLILKPVAFLKGNDLFWKIRSLDYSYSLKSLPLPSIMPKGCGFSVTAG